MDIRAHFVFPISNEETNTSKNSDPIIIENKVFQSKFRSFHLNYIRLKSQNIKRRSQLTGEFDKYGLAFQSRIYFKFHAKRLPYTKVAVRNYEFEGSNYKIDATRGHSFLLYNPKSSQKDICYKNLGSLRGAF